MENQTLIEWLEDLCKQLDEPEKPLFRTEYSQGIADGATDTQKLIAQKIRFAIEQEKARLTQRALDSATPCPDCGSKKLGIHSIKCSRYRPPSK